MFSVVKTADGSYTIYNRQLNQHYHSVHGALSESRHVFIDNGLQFFAGTQRSEIKILEVGFGTGLNAFLACRFADERRINIIYKGLEPFPLPSKIVAEIELSVKSGFSEDDRILFTRLHQYSGKISQITGSFSFSVIETTLQEFKTPEHYDVIFFDAFAFNAQPELWTTELFEKLFHQLNSGGILVTYAAKGIVKRNLKAAGFTVETLPGPPRKREMVRATKA